MIGLGSDKNCIRPPYEKLKPLKSGFIENSIFENNRDPWHCSGGLDRDEFGNNNNVGAPEITLYLKIT